MTRFNNSTQAFLALLRAGLWETDVRLSRFNPIDFTRVLTLAEEQSVVGLVAAGLEHVIDLKVPKVEVLQFVGQALKLEQDNSAMNYFINVIIDKMKEVGISSLLVKGQGIAQCYERPLWRACGDVDLLLDDDNYSKAKAFLIPLANSVEQEDVYCKHQGMTIQSWVIEIHGNMNTELSFRIDGFLARLQSKLFEKQSFRVWKNGEVTVLLPEINTDIIFIFTHFLKHFYKGGLGLRQICDWCRLLWAYKESVNIPLLEEYLKQMGLFSEWRVFAVFAVNYLGLPIEAMPLYSTDRKWRRKAQRVATFIMKVGNMGHNRDISYYKYPYLMRKSVSMWRKVSDVFNHAMIFPLDSFRFLSNLMLHGFRSAANQLKR